MASTVTVQCHGKNYVQKLGPMQAIGAVVPAVLQQAGLRDNVANDECKLLLNGKVLDLMLPVRFANLPTGAKLTLQTGHEPVLGFQEKGPEVAAVTASTLVSHASTDALEPPQHINKQPKPSKQELEQRSEALLPLTHAGVGPSTSASAVQESEDKDRSDRKFLAGREICVFTREAEVELDAQSESFGELDDEAYEVTEADIKIQLAGYAARRAAEEKHLMTRQMREAEEARKAAAYGHVPVRIEFPDGIVIQALFPATSAMEELVNLVKEALVPEAASTFHLFTAPPKVELKDMSVTLYAAGLVPAARVHVGFRGFASQGLPQQTLRQEIMSLCGPPPSRASVMRGRQRPVKQAAVGNSNLEQVPLAADIKTASAAPQTRPRDTSTAKGTGVPSWMKIGRR